MLRSLALVSLSASSLLWFGCSNDDQPIPPKPPVVVDGPDMADDGTGGNGTPDMAMPQQQGGGDMGPALPDLAGIPLADHDPTQHPPLPRVATVFGPRKSGMKAPEVWTVVWKGDKAIGDQVNKFQTWMMTSDYWKTGMSEWGVGAGSAKGVLELSDTPPASIEMADLDSLVDANMGQNGWPTKNSNTVISLIIDPATTVTDGGAAAGCVQFDGYHSLSSNGGVPFLVNVYCKDANNAPDWNNLTVTISHETAEAASDWNLQSNRVYYPGTTALMAGGGENGDVCISMNASIKASNGETYLVQELYSDALAAQGTKGFCINPTNPDEPFFGAGLYSGGTNDAAISITRAAGKGSAKIKIEPFSYDPSFGPVGFYVVGSWLPKGVTLSPDIARRADPNHAGQVLGMRAWGNPGSTTEVTVSVDNTYAGGTKPQPFLIIAHNYDRTKFNIWWGSLTVKN